MVGACAVPCSRCTNSRYLEKPSRPLLVSWFSTTAGSIRSTTHLPECQLQRAHDPWWYQCLPQLPLRSVPLEWDWRAMVLCHASRRLVLSLWWWFRSPWTPWRGGISQPAVSAWRSFGSSQPDHVAFCQHSLSTTKAASERSR